MIADTTRQHTSSRASTVAERVELAARDARVGRGPAGLAAVIILAMNPDGTLPASVGRLELIRRAEISAPSFNRYASVLERAELITRHVEMTEAEPGHWSRRLVIAAHPRFAR